MASALSKRQHQIALEMSNGVEMISHDGVGVVLESVEVVHEHDGGIQCSLESELMDEKLSAPIGDCHMD